MEIAGLELRLQVTYIIESSYPWQPLRETSRK